jgi:hypothetical protein
MDVEAIALQLHRMRPWLDQTVPYANLTRKQFDSAPLGYAHVTIDPTSCEPAASFNRNRIHLCGRAGGLTREGLMELFGQFDSAGVKRAFVWLNPGPEQDTVREWLESQRLERVVWTRYPTVLLTAPPEPSPASDFEIRTVDRNDVAAARAQFGLTPMAGFEESIGHDGFRHYIAFDAGRPVASAALVQFEDVGYLTYAQTSESVRR